MKLHIENFAKISSADIEFKGLTVIAGENNTGKSTVGKILYSFYRAFSNKEMRIRRERLRSMCTAIAQGLEIEETAEIERLILQGKSLSEIVKVELSRFWKSGAKLGMPEPDDDRADGLVKSYVSKIQPNYDYALKMVDSAYAMSIVARVLDCVFHRQYHPIFKHEGDSKLVLTVNGQENTFLLSSAQGTCRNPTNFLNKAYFISSPDVLSLVNVKDFGEDENASKYFDKYTFELVRALRAQKSLQNAAEEERLSAKIAPIKVELDKLIRGVFVLDDDGDMALFEEGCRQAAKAENLSMGLKYFVLLRLMLERGLLNDRDVLILDEPENHLHPQWQVILAKVLIMLRETFDLTVLITSHSQFFVNALQRFCISEGIAEKTEFYQSCNDVRVSGMCTFESKGVFASDILSSFNQAYDYISDMSSEFEGESK